MPSLRRSSLAALALAFCSTAAFAAPVDIAENGGFETGDFTDWTQFPTGAGQQTIDSTNPSSGSYAACIDNDVRPSNSLIKNDNIGVGVVMPGQSVTIRFDARGGGADGGVAFAEFFSELDGGGTSSSEILGGAPLALDPDPDVWKSFLFVTNAGPDVSGGVTFQIGAVTGAAPTSTMMLCVDNLSVVVDATIPTEQSSWGAVKTLYE